MKILLVDDNPAMRSLSRRYLQRAGLAPDEIEEAADGAEALRRIDASAPDLILSDWSMPRLSGIELLETLTQRGSTISFVLMSTDTTPEMRARAAAAGARCFITKPFTEESLISALADLLR